MVNFSRFERILIALAFLLILISSSQFLLGDDKILAWLGVTASESRPKVAEVIEVVDVLRRRSFNTSDFRTVSEHQSIFGKDTVMTSEKGDAMIKFLDGSTVELGPNTIVEIDSRPGDDPLGNLTIKIEVKKGVVRAEPNANLQLEQNGAAVPVQPIVRKPKPSPVVAQTPSPRPAALSCAFVKADRELKVLNIGITCNQTPSSLLIHTTIGGQTEDIPVNFTGNQGQAQFTAPKPGKFDFVIDDQKKTTFAVEVPVLIATLKWKEPAVLCQDRLDWETSNLNPSKIVLIGDDNRVLLSGKTPSEFSELSRVIKIPKQVRVVELFAEGFQYQTPPLLVSGWKRCLALTLPLNGERVHRMKNGQILFTWKSPHPLDNFLFRLSKSPQMTTDLYRQETTNNLIRVGPKTPGTLYWQVTDLTTGEVSAIFAVQVL